MSISVIIPAYNEAGRIGECIEAIQRQSIQPDEVLIGIDNCPSTMEAVRPYLSDKVKAMFFGSHSGCYLIRNTLAMIAKGDILVFFDADDIMNPDFIEKMEQKTIDNCLCRPLFINKHSNGRLTKPKTAACGCFSIMKMDFVTCSGFEAWDFGADSEFLNRAVIHGMNVAFSDSPLFIRNLHGDSLTQNKDTGMKSEKRQLRRREITRRRMNKYIKSHIEIIARGIYDA